MINSRNIDDLHPIVAEKARAFLALCASTEIDVLIISTYRDNESQAALYAQGRTKPGNIVTNAKAGQSFHNWHVAFDVVPLRNGKPVWGTAGQDGQIWNRLGLMGESVGLEWAGRWTRFKEYPHFQFTGGHDLAYFQNGGKLA